MATDIQVNNLDKGYQSVMTNGRHSLIGDEPVHVQGTDTE
jgi:putative redox protein